MVYGLATWIAQSHPLVEVTGLTGRHIYECDLQAFQRSVLYAHELENKTQLVTRNCAEENAILFLDRTHLAVATGRFDERLDRTIANPPLPFMLRDEIAVIGATDLGGYELMTKLNPEFAGRSTWCACRSRRRKRR